MAIAKEKRLGLSDRLDYDLNRWAEWVNKYKPLSAEMNGYGNSPLGNLGEIKGHPPEFWQEARVEALVMKLAAKHPRRADVIRLEYSAGWEELLVRHGYNLTHPPCLKKQAQRARALGMSPVNYRSYLIRARSFLLSELYQ